MKKVLLATTALTMSAGVAFADVSISGNARMGLQYKGGSAAVAASAGYDAALSARDAASTAYLDAVSAQAAKLAARDTAVANMSVANVQDLSSITAVATAQAELNTANTAVTTTQSALGAAETALAGESAAQDATSSTTTLEKRMTVNMSGSVETTSGMTLGASMNLRANEGSAAVTTGAVVSLSTGGVKVAVGNIDGALENMPGMYSASAGLTGLGWGGVLGNTDANGYWGWDAYSSSGNGAEGVEVTFSSGSFAGHVSYTSTDLGSAANRTAGHGAYTMGDWTVAVGGQYDADNADNDKTIVTVGGKVGDFGVGIGYANNGGETKLALNGSASFGATSVSAYVANEESADNSAMGLGVSHDLGGASIAGGVAKTTSGQTRADMGVKFSF